MNIETVKIEDLKPDPKNVRRHPARNLETVKNSLRRFGQQKPLVVNSENIIVAGNATWEAAKSLGWTEINITRTELRGSDARAYSIVDNKTTDLSEFDNDELENALQELTAEDFDLGDLGFDENALAELFLVPKIIENEIPEPPAIPITKPGDLYKLGEHRLICGNAMRREDTKKLFAGATMDCAVYDPPWNKQLLPELPRDKLVFGDGSTVSIAIGLFGSPTWVFVWDCVTSWFVPARPLRRIKLCLWYGNVDDYNQNGSHIATHRRESRKVTNTRGSYWFIPDKRGIHLSDLFQSQITKLHSDGPHPHEKPIDWIRLLLANCTHGIIYDPFLGSGTTLIAAEQLGRKSYDMEIEPRYVDVAVGRWENLTGKKAELIQNVSE